MTRAIAAFAAALLLAGCATYDVRRARTDLAGMNVVDLQACAGVPARKPTQISPDTWLLTYAFASSATPAFSIKVLTDLDLEIGNKGGCSLAIRVAEPGYVQAVHFTGDEFSTSGPQAACAPLVRECVEHSDKSHLPSGFTLARWMKQQDDAK